MKSRACLSSSLLTQTHLAYLRTLCLSSLLLLIKISSTLKCTREDPPKTQSLFIKKLCIHSYVFKLQSPTKYSPFDAMHLSRHFFHCSKQVLNPILMPFSVSDCFLFHLSHIDKKSPLRAFFIQGNNKKKSLGWDQVHRECGP